VGGTSLGDPRRRKQQKFGRKCYEDEGLTSRSPLKGFFLEGEAAVNFLTASKLFGRGIQKKGKEEK